MSKTKTIIVTDNAELALSLPPHLRRQAGIKAGDRMEVRVSRGIITFVPKLPSDDDAYTSEQRSVIAAQIAEGLEDIRKGRVSPRFDTVDEMLTSLESGAKKASRRQKTRTR